MHTLGQMIRARRVELGLTLRQLALMAQCAKSYLSAIENDRRGGPPSPAMLERLERSLRLEPGRLLRAGQWQATPAPVRREVQVMRQRDKLYARLAQRLREKGLDSLHRSGELRDLVNQLAPTGDVESVPLPVQVPVINKVAAGYPAEFTDLDYPARIADEYVAAPDMMDPQAFAARVVGDSMEPRYSEGDIVIFSPERDTPPGADCFVRFERDAETTFKRVYFERDEQRRELIRLQPLNSAYAPRLVPRERIAGMYAAAYVLRSV